MGTTWRGLDEDKVKPMPVDQELFRDVIGRFASGVTVISTRAGGRDLGTTASAVSSLSMEPPMLLVCMNQTSETGQAVAAEQTFVVNILGEHQTDVAKRFATKAPNKFQGVRIDRTPSGLPMISQALAHLECRVAETATGGTHLVFLSLVEAARGAEGNPLTYYRGRFGRFEEAAQEAAERAAEAVDARCLIQSGVAERVAGRLTPAQLAELRRHADAAQGAAAANPPDLHALRLAGHEFHEAFVSLAGNDLLLDIYRGLRIDSIWLRMTRGRFASPEYLAEVVDACAAGDAETAKRLLREHAQDVRRLIADTLARTQAR